MLTQHVLEEEVAADEQLSIKVEHVAALPNIDGKASVKGRATREVKKSIVKAMIASLMAKIKCSSF